MDIFLKVITLSLLERIIVSINVENARKITRKLAFPRLTGTDGEKKAIKLVKEEFNNIGIEPLSDEFTTSFTSWILARYIFFPVAALLIGMAIFHMIFPWVSLILGILILCGGMYATRIAGMGSGKRTIGKVYTTENIYGTLKSANSKAHVVFMAHWDSKGQTFRAMVRIIIFVISIFGMIIISLIILITSILKIINPALMNMVFDLVLLIISIVLGSIACLNFFNKLNNISPGASDNAAAVGVMLELARIFKEIPPRNVDLMFISTGSEELNLGGAIAFMKKHASEYDPKSSYFIIMDPVGGKGTIRLVTSYGFPKKNSSEKLNMTFKKVAREKNIDLKTIWLPIGAWSDFMPVANQGFQACWLASVQVMSQVHTIQDSMKIITDEGLKNMLLLNVNLIKNLDEEIE